MYLYDTYMRHVRPLSNIATVIHLQDMPNGGASDASLKKEITDVAGALDRVLALRPVTWYWKSDVNNQELEHGFIAQELEQVFPELVTIREWKDGTPRKHVSVSGLVPYLVKALEEQQQQRIDQLEQEIRKLQKQ